MSDHLPVLKVRLFGGFSASYGEIPVSFGRNTTTKAMKLLQILLYHGDTGISRDKLLDELYGREELADAANNLRVTAHRLKKIIVDAGLPSHDYINIKKGIYRWDAPMPTEVDAHQFKVLSKDVQTCTDKVKKLALLKKICCTVGNFFQNFQEMNGSLLKASNIRIFILNPFRSSVSF